VDLPVFGRPMIATVGSLGMETREAEL
jgi:hypothetical protein